MLLLRMVVLSLLTVLPVVGLLIPYGSPFIHLNGRWDYDATSWWGSTGFKVAAINLNSLTLYLGELTTQPVVSIGLSVNYGAWQTVNITQGANVIPLNLSSGVSPAAIVLRVATESWQNNNVQLEAIELNSDAIPVLYIPQPLNFQFIGDSLSAGVNGAQGIINSWTFITAEYFKAEHNIQAQPGICLTDIVCYGNENGQSYEYFRTEDPGYFTDTNHNYTTPWNFIRDQPPTHVVIHIGANDASTTYNVSEAAFLSTYETFLVNLRNLYPTQPFFILTPWGWPVADGSVDYYYTDPSPYAQLVADRHNLGDSNIFLVNTTGWVTWADVSPANQHPSQAGELKIANEFIAWLEGWGMSPESTWQALAEYGTL